MVIYSGNGRCERALASQDAQKMKASAHMKPTCEKDFILNAVRTGIRFDGRQLYDYRKLKISFGVNFGHCEVCLGNTRVLAQVSCEIVKPTKSRPTEGQLYLNIELSPMASPEFEIGRQTDFAVLLNRYIERCLRESRPVDMESLCIIAGEKVWCLRVDIQVLDDGGNILDCSCIAAIAALSHFRRPEVTVTGEDVTVHSPKDRDPIPLNVHHKPICVTFGFINDSDKPLVDPTRKEENVLNGQIIMAMNSLGEICCAQMSGGVSVGPEQILLCCKIASVKVSEIAEKIKSALAEDFEKRFPPKVKWKDEVTIKPVLEGAPPTLITQTFGKPIEMDLTETIKEAKDQVKDLTANESDVTSVRLEGPNTGSIGEGGENSWIMIEDESSDDDTVEIIKVKPPKEQKKRPIIGRIESPIVVNDDSEEDDTVVITSEDFGFNHKNNGSKHVEDKSISENKNGLEDMNDEKNAVEDKNLPEDENTVEDGKDEEQTLNDNTESTPDKDTNTEASNAKPSPVTPKSKSKKKRRKKNR